MLDDNLDCVVIHVCGRQECLASYAFVLQASVFRFLSFMWQARVLGLISSWVQERIQLALEVTGKPVLKSACLREFVENLRQIAAHCLKNRRNLDARYHIQMMLYRDDSFGGVKIPWNRASGQAVCDAIIMIDLSL